MLTRRQIAKVKKSLAAGTGTDIKISRTQIRRSVKHGENLFTSLASLASLGAKLLPFAMRGVSKVTPASALGEIGLKELFGRGITIPKKIYPNVTTFCNRIYQITTRPNKESLSNRRSIGYPSNT